MSVFTYTRANSLNVNMTNMVNIYVSLIYHTTQIYKTMELDLPFTAKVTTGLLALPHIILFLQRGRIPKFNYIVIVAVSLLVIAKYTKMLEACGQPSPRHTLATVFMPLLVTLAVMTSIVMYTMNFSPGGDNGNKLGSYVGQVHQYRFNDVVDRFREIVTNRHEENVDSINP